MANELELTIADGTTLLVQVDGVELSLEAPIVDGASGVDNNGANVNTQGVGVFANKVGDTLNFKGIEAGAGITVTDTPGNNTITVATDGALGEANDAANVGGQAEVFRDKTGTDLNFRTLQGQNATTVAQTGDTITISTPAAPVQSVNGNTGVVLLDTDDVPEGSTNEYYTEAKVSANATVTANAAHAATTGNPHSTALTDLPAANLAQLNTLIADATLDDASDPRTPTAHAASHAQGGTDEINAAALASGAATSGQALTADGTGGATFTDVANSVQGQTGVVVLDTDDVPEGTTNEYYTEAKVTANAAVAANTAKVSATGSIDTHSDVDTTTSAPVLNEVLTWDGANFTPQPVPSAPVTSVNGNTGVVSLTTADVPELGNQYFTNAKVAAAPAVAANTAKVSADGSINTHSDVDTTSSPPALNDLLRWDGSNFVPDPDAITSVNTQTGVVVLDTDDVAEGATNLYFTNGRVSANPDVLANNAKVSAAGSIDTHSDVDTTTTPPSTNDVLTWDGANFVPQAPGAAPVTSVNGFTGAVVLTTSAVPEGSNEYYTEAKVSANASVVANTAKVSADGSVTTHSDVTSAGSGQIITALERADIGTAVQPGNNVSVLTNDANYIDAAGAPVQSVNTQTGAVVLDTDDVAEGATNLYYTELRVTSNPTVAANTAKVSASGSIDTHSDVDTTSTAPASGDLLRWDGSNFVPDTIETTDVAEGTNLYYTEGRVSANASVVANTAKVSADGSIDTHSDVDTTTSAPNVGEHLEWDGSNWVPAVESVLSVNTQTGAVVLDTDDVAEGATNLYYTEARVSANASVVANTAKVSADGSIDTHSDVDVTSTAPTLDDRLRWDGSNWVPEAMPVFGTEYQVVTSPALSTTTSTTFQNKITMNTTSLVGGNYLLQVDYGWNHNSTGNDFEARVQQDAVDLGEIHKQEPQDSAGTFGASGTSQRHIACRTFELALTAGTYTFTLDYRTDTAGTASGIWDACMRLFRVS